MRNRSRSSKEAGVGQDSFLDVVSNIVGILIILVVIVGSQIKEGAVSEPVPSAGNHTAARQESERHRSLASARDAQWAEVETQLRDTLLRESILHDEVTDLHDRGMQMETNVAAAKRHGEALDTSRDTLHRRVETLKAEADVKKQQQWDLLQRRNQLENKAQQLRQRLVHYKEDLEGEDGGPFQIPHKMTPITRSVETEEVHFILQDGRIAYIPMNDLVRNYQRRLDQHVTALLMGQERTDVIGPIDGFSLHAQARMRGNMPEARWMLRTPPMAEIGESPQMALATVSKFRNTLSHLSPSRHVLTFWVYPSAFPILQALREEIYKEGFSLAMRPLPEGTPIAGSPDGRRSVAQ